MDTTLRVALSFSAAKVLLREDKQEHFDVDHLSDSLSELEFDYDSTLNDLEDNDRVTLLPSTRILKKLGDTLHQTESEYLKMVAFELLDSQFTGRMNVKISLGLQKDISHCSVELKDALNSYRCTKYSSIQAGHMVKNVPLEGKYNVLELVNLCRGSCAHLRDAAIRSGELEKAIEDCLAHPSAKRGVFSDRINAVNCSIVSTTARLNKLSKLIAVLGGTAVAESEQSTGLWLHMGKPIDLSMDKRSQHEVNVALEAGDKQGASDKNDESISIIVLDESESGAIFADETRDVVTLKAESPGISNAGDSSACAVGASQPKHNLCEEDTAAFDNMEYLKDTSKFDGMAEERNDGKNVSSRLASQLCSSISDSSLGVETSSQHSSDDKEWASSSSGLSRIPRVRRSVISVPDIEGGLPVYYEVNDD